MASRSQQHQTIVGESSSSRVGVFPHRRYYFPCHLTKRTNHKPPILQCNIRILKRLATIAEVISPSKDHWHYLCQLARLPRFSTFFRFRTSMNLQNAVSSRLTWAIAVASIVVGGVGIWFFVNRPTSANDVATNHPDESKSDDRIVVECVTPRKGGIDRICLQPGTVEPFESADLYTKVSGFLAEQKVDIGYRVAGRRRAGPDRGPGIREAGEAGRGRRRAGGGQG